MKKLWLYSSGVMNRVLSVHSSMNFFCSLFVATVCPGLTAPANGGITFTDGINFGSAASYSCNEGFSLSSDEERVCLDLGTWTGSEPSCIGE